APTEEAVLRAVAVERDTEGEHLAFADQLGGFHDVVGRDVVQRAALVVLAPAAPVRQLFRGLGDGRLVDLDVHRASFPHCSRFAQPGPAVGGNIATGGGVTSSG